MYVKKRDCIQMNITFFQSLEIGLKLERTEACTAAWLTFCGIIPEARQLLIQNLVDIFFMFLRKHQDKLFGGGLTVEFMVLKRTQGL